MSPELSSSNSMNCSVNESVVYLIHVLYTSQHNSHTASEKTHSCMLSAYLPSLQHHHSPLQSGIAVRWRQTERHDYDTHKKAQGMEGMWYRVCGRCATCEMASVLIMSGIGQWCSRCGYKGIMQNQVSQFLLLVAHFTLKSIMLKQYWNADSHVLLIS